MSAHHQGTRNTLTHLPFLTVLLLAALLLEDSVTLTMSSACDLELVLLAAVGSWVRSLLPLVSSLITSSALSVATSESPATCGTRGD